MKKNFLQTLLILFITLNVNAQLDWSPIGAEISSDANADVFGSVVALNDAGDIMATGFPKSNGAGIVQVYSYENDEWMLLGSDIVGEIVGEDFGWSVSLSADGLTLAVGAPDDNGSGSNAGFARVYEWSGSDWTQKGTTLTGANNDDYFGYEVSLSADGSMLIVGAPKNDTNDFNAGVAYIYEWNGSDWEQRGSTLAGTEGSEEFGQTVGISADGDHVTIGSPYFFNVYHPGLTRVYSWSGSDWVQLGADIIGEGNLDHSATSLEIAADGQSVAIGSFNNSHDNVFNAGHVRVFDWSGSAWEQRGEDIDGDASYDNSSVGLSFSDDGNTVAVGAPNNDGNGDKSGQVKVYHWNNDQWSMIGSSLYGSVQGEEMGRAVALNSDGTVLAGAAPKTSNLEALVRTYLLTGTSNLTAFDDLGLVVVSPNPTSGFLQINLEESYPQIRVQIYNSTGQLMKGEKYEQVNQIDLNIEGAAGFYFVHLLTLDGASATLNILKQ